MQNVLTTRRIPVKKEGNVFRLPTLMPDEARALLCGLIIRGKEGVPPELTSRQRREFIQYLLARAGEKQLFDDKDFRLAVLIACFLENTSYSRFRKRILYIFPQPFANDCLIHAEHMITLEALRIRDVGIKKTLPETEKKFEEFKERLGNAQKRFLERKSQKP